MEDEESHRSARRAAVGALAAELGHDLQSPLNLLRSATDRVARGEQLDEEDLALLREELERLGALGARLRRLAQRPRRREACTPRAIVDLALKHVPAPPQLELELAQVMFQADRELLAVALAELLDNAARARRERVGVRFVLGEATGFCVWDDGPGFTLEQRRASAWGESTRDGAAGLGLTVAFRAARAHGFGLRIARQEERTELWLTFPASAVEVAAKLTP